MMTFIAVSGAMMFSGLIGFVIGCCFSMGQDDGQIWIEDMEPEHDL